MTHLTDAEREFATTLPSPPRSATLRATNIWIVEWLADDEPMTGLSLHEWMKDRRPGWSMYFSCKTKADVLQAIERATERVRRSQLKPVLHLEAHGGAEGLEGPNGNGSREHLTWEELTEPFQKLNLATHCNLIVVIAACVGFAGILALRGGPRAPAAALVGPDDNVLPRDLLAGAKELYRRLMDHDTSITAMVESASREAATVNFEWEPFVILAYESLIKFLIGLSRPDQQRERLERCRAGMPELGTWSAAEIRARLASLPPFPRWQDLQRMWDHMFMMDVEPSNQERFGLDLKTIVESVTVRYGSP